MKIDFFFLKRPDASALRASAPRNANAKCKENLAF